MTDEIINSPTKSKLKKTALIKGSKRATVRISLRAQRKKFKELEKLMSEGKDVSDDIDSCKGEIDLLFKELQSIEDGGHTTFLHAKELIAPKKNISSKKEFLRGEIRNAQTKIEELEEKLITPKLEEAEKDSILQSISEKESVLRELKEEMDALKSFNHTRYVSAREDSRKAKETQQQIEQLDAHLHSLSNQLIEAAQNGNYILIESLNEQALQIKQQRANLLQTGDSPSNFGEEDNNLDG